MQIRARNFFLVQLDQHVLLQRFGDEEFTLALRPVAPENVFWFREFSDFLYPIKHGLVHRLRIADSIGREYGGRDIFHETKMSILTKNERLRHVESLSGQIFFLTVTA